MLTISPRQATSGPKWAFGKVLREFREKKGMSQEHLADAAGLDRSFISLVERGIQSPNAVVLLKIADVLGAPAAELIQQSRTCARRPLSFLVVGRWASRVHRLSP